MSMVMLLAMSGLLSSAIAAPLLIAVPENQEFRRDGGVRGRGRPDADRWR
jgi:hypothetical protein